MGQKVLVVDDDPAQLRLLWEILSRSGYEPHPAADGIAALEKLRHNRYDLVVTDFNMPGLNGAQLAESVAELSPETPVILLTGSIDVEPLPSQVSFVVRKPYLPDHLLDLLRSAMVGR